MTAVKNKPTNKKVRIRAFPFFFIILTSCNNETEPLVQTTCSCVQQLSSRAEFLEGKDKTVEIQRQ